MRLVLGIETSCDETAAAVIDMEAPPGARIRAHALLSQIEDHRAYGGVVPEIAARSHLEHLPGLIAGALAEAGIGVGDLGAVAATCGPGLIGGVLVGAMTGKSIAAARALPFIAVNHLEAHALSPRLIADVPFPYLLLLVSGGHCQLVAVEGVGTYTRLGGTIDDAVGEAFDKAAKMLGLGFPGGPAVEAAAAGGDPGRFPLPRPLLGRPGCDFSFSGLKTALRQTLAGIAAQGPVNERDVADLCASFQATVAAVLVDRTRNAMEMFRRRNEIAGIGEASSTRTLVVAGGVAANRGIRAALASLTAAEGFVFMAPPGWLCTDNAAMIAWAGAERLTLAVEDGLAMAPRPRWPLADLRPPCGATPAA